MIEELEATRSELAQAERQAGMLEERQRLAGEIHDTLAQDFTSIVHAPGGGRAVAWKATCPPRRQHIDQARATAREGLSEARRFVWALRPEVVRARAAGPGAGAGDRGAGPRKAACRPTWTLTGGAAPAARRRSRSPCCAPPRRR